MSCKELEQAIYLYEELTTSEKLAVDQHLVSCKRCIELMEEVRRSQSFIMLLAEAKPQPESFSRLTSNIMQAVNEHEKQKQPVRLAFLDQLIVRYGMMAVSFLLLLFFAVEQQSVDSPAPVDKPVANTVTLNSTSFLETLRERKHKEEKEISLYACVKRAGCSESIVENFKLKRHYDENQ